MPFQFIGDGTAWDVYCFVKDEEQKLEHVIIRAIASELAGKLLEADASTVLRKVGNPVNGVCQPSDN